MDAVSATICDGWQAIRRNISCSTIKLITRLIWWFIWNPATAPLASLFRWSPTHRIGAFHLINAVGRGYTGHHGDELWGGGCVGARQNSCTIPTVENLRGGSFLFPPKPIVVKLLKSWHIFAPLVVELLKATKHGWALAPISQIRHAYPRFVWYISSSNR